VGDASPAPGAGDPWLAPPIRPVYAKVTMNDDLGRRRLLNLGFSAAAPVEKQLVPLPFAPGSIPGLSEKLLTN
jgi:hypothetical protein